MDTTIQTINEQKEKSRAVFQQFIDSVYEGEVTDNPLIWKEQIQAQNLALNRTFAFLEEETLLLQQYFPDVCFAYSVYDKDEKRNQIYSIWYDAVIKIDDSYCMMSITLKYKGEYKEKVKPMFKVYLYEDELFYFDEDYDAITEFSDEEQKVFKGIYDFFLCHIQQLPEFRLLRMTGKLQE